MQHRIFSRFNRLASGIGFTLNCLLGAAGLLVVSECAVAETSKSLNPGSYTAVYLAPYPQASGCTTQACQLLDRMEREGYEAARSGVVSWLNFVRWYYEQRARIYPHSDDSIEVDEMRKLQLQLARRLDLQLITEREWRQQLEAKLASIRAPK